MSTRSRKGRGRPNLISDARRIQLVAAGTDVRRATEDARRRGITLAEWVRRAIKNDLDRPKTEE